VWIVTAKVEGKNPGEAATKGLTEKVMAKLGSDEQGINEGGVVVHITCGDGKPEEVGRVSFDRRHSSQPKKSHKQALQEMIDVANDAMMILNQQEQIVRELLKTYPKGEMQ
jgi:hypothetical protein